MLLLVAVYESGTTSGVHMKDVMRVYGLQGSNLDAFEKDYVDFKSDAWLADYNLYKEKLFATMKVQPTPREILEDEKDSFEKYPDRKGGVLH